MKKFLILFLFGCSGPGYLSLTVTSVQGSTVYAKSNNRIYKAEIKNLSDTVKVGTKITALPGNCAEAFIRIR